MIVSTCTCTNSKDTSVNLTHGLPQQGSVRPTPNQYRETLDSLLDYLHAHVVCLLVRVAIR